MCFFNLKKGQIKKSHLSIEVHFRYVFSGHEAKSCEKAREEGALVYLKHFLDLKSLL